VLVANTYHELSRPGPVLDRLFEALRPGGRLVVVDPGPEAHATEAREDGAHHHETPAAAEDRIRRAGFEIASREDRFIEAGGRERWWLVVARKPSPGARPPLAVGPSGSSR
jgi:SAM-dependent methyltransferase